uniref:Uncharacterized protein n=1 Tax=Clytia hemisphaerica TaxID=252671 RepID=A0A7M5XL52_9CNID
MSANEIRPTGNQPRVVEQQNKKQPWVFIIEDDASTECSDEISEDFGGANSLQAEVYRLGLRLEEIDEEIGDQIRQQQQQQKPSTTTGNTGYEDNLLNGGCGDSS